MSAIKNRYATFKFPFRFEEGRVAAVGGRPDQPPTIPNIQESIGAGVRQLVLTSPGERVMNGNFGVGVVGFLFSPLGSQVSGLIAYQIQEQLSFWETRVTLSELISSDNAFNSLDFGLSLKLTEFDATTALSFSVGF